MDSNNVVTIKMDSKEWATYYGGVLDNGVVRDIKEIVKLAIIAIVEKNDINPFEQYEFGQQLSL